MAPKAKLTYFDARGAAEAVRYLLAYGDIEYEDHRVAFEEWQKLKPSTPFGKIPILEINGKIIHQSIAICRYLAKQVDLAGASDWEAAEIDAVADVITDIKVEINEYGWVAGPDEKPKKKKKLVDETLPFNLSRLEKVAQENNEYFVNGKLSYADIVFASSVEYFSGVMEFDIIKEYPTLQKLVDNVHNDPRIKLWVEKRPKTLH